MMAQQDAAHLDLLYHASKSPAELQRETEIIEQALPCPFCGGTSLETGYWSLDAGEVESIECRQCFSGAPFTAWQRRFT